MTVSVTEPIKIILYIPQPPQDSPYPVGHWIAARRAVGDGTGGIIDIVFAPVSAAEASKYLWSWEGFNLRTEPSPAGIIPGAVTMIPAERHTDGVGNVNGILFSKYFEIVPSAALAGFPSMNGTLSDSIGYIHQPDGGLTNSYTIDLSVNTNLTIYRGAGWGYLWHPQARRLASGPRRP